VSSGYVKLVKKKAMGGFHSLFKNESAEDAEIKRPWVAGAPPMAFVLNSNI